MLQVLGIHARRAVSFSRRALQASSHGGAGGDVSSTLVSSRGLAGSTSVQVPTRHEDKRSVKVHRSDDPCTSLTVADITTCHDDRMLKVVWAEGETSTFPYVWLRDNCRCNLCFHQGSQSRIQHIENLDLDAEPKNAQVVRDGEEVAVVWSDGHVSNYSANWLHPRAFDPAQHRARQHTYKLTRSPWGSELLQNLPRATFEEVMHDDVALLAWLKQLEKFGFVVVSGAPTKPGQVRRLAERVGFIKKTHYGEDFTVIAKQEPSNVAYLSGPLQLHTDLPYYQYKPGVQFIHCITQYEGDGGDSEVTDGLHAAKVLHDKSPDLYDTLTNTHVDWFDEGTDETGEFYKVLQLPVICTDATGEVQRINFSQPQRDSFFSVKPERVALWYAALKAFHAMLTHPDNCLRFKMIPGTILTFDNHRILHGRSAYKSGHGSRHVEGCYVDWDEVRSRRRVLEKKLGVELDSVETLSVEEEDLEARMKKEEKRKKKAERRAKKEKREVKFTEEGGDPEISQGDVVNSELQGDVLNSELQGDVLNSELQGDVLNSEVQGDVLNSELQGDVLNSELQGDVLNSELQGDAQKSELAGKN